MASKHRLALTHLVRALMGWPTCHTQVACRCWTCCFRCSKLRYRASPRIIPDLGVISRGTATLTVKATGTAQSGIHHLDAVRRPDNSHVDAGGMAVYQPQQDRHEGLVVKVHVRRPRRRQAVDLVKTINGRGAFLRLLKHLAQCALALADPLGQLFRAAKENFSGAEYPEKWGTRRRPVLARTASCRCPDGRAATPPRKAARLGWPTPVGTPAAAAPPLVSRRPLPRTSPHSWWPVSAATPQVGPLRALPGRHEPSPPPLPQGRRH